MRRAAILATLALLSACSTRSHEERYYWLCTKDNPCAPAAPASAAKP